MSPHTAPRRRSGGAPVPTMLAPIGPCYHSEELTAVHCNYCLRDRLVGLVNAVRETVPDWRDRFGMYEAAREALALETEGRR